MYHLLLTYHVYVTVRVKLFAPERSLRYLMHILCVVNADITTPYLFIINVILTFKA